MDPLDIGQILLGGLLLYGGAEWLVKGSAGLARAFGVKPLVIGLTVVAYGTSAPELAVSATAILKGSSPLVLGNVIGSCVANIALILGITALISPPSVDGRLIRREVPVMVISTLALPLVLITPGIVRIEAAILLVCSVAFTLFTLSSSATTDDEDQEPGGEEGLSKPRLAGITLVGLALLLFGGKIFVDGARGIAIALGMSEHLVGLTVVAIGTSLPELAASVVAALRGYSGLAVGNVVGSNIFNIFLVLGAVGLLRPIQGAISQYRFDLIFLVGVTVLGVLLMRGSRRISRTEGVLLLFSYAAFIVLATLGW